MACLLLIDQEPVQVSLLAMLLEAKSVESVRCLTIEQAMAICEARDDIAAMLLDLQMCRADGWRLSEWHHWFPKIVGMSSQYDESAAKQLCREYSLDAYLSLPVKPQRFHQYIQHLLRDHICPVTTRAKQSCPGGGNSTTLGVM